MNATELRSESDAFQSESIKRTDKQRMTTNVQQGARQVIEIERMNNNNNTHMQEICSAHNMCALEMVCIFELVSRSHDLFSIASIHISPIISFEWFIHVRIGIVRTELYTIQ